MASVAGPRQHWLARPVSFGLLIAATGVVAVLNALSRRLFESFADKTALDAILDLSGVSAIVWFALYALVAIGSSSEPARPRPADWAIAALVIIAALLPVPQLAAAALVLLGLWCLLAHRATPTIGRMGVILLALSGSLLWGRLALSLFAPPLLSIDAQLVALFAQVPVDGNFVHFATGSGGYTLAPGCSSLHNVSLAILLWATLTQLFDVPVRWQSLLGCLAAVVALLAVNIARLAAMAHMPQHFVWLHEGPGETIFAWASLVLAMIVTIIIIHVAPRAVR